ncbi:MAG: hypothetical protein NO475_00160 [Candidatus Methanomethylicia archaeon]|jgi:glucose-6-phosphate isomerase|nr:hypothetical protein [Candidatus Methanomethylicia archaeon]MCQ5340186.1 hypothetical protein [Candidatus Methanomethylicia archaeon]
MISIFTSFGTLKVDNDLSLSINDKRLIPQFRTLNDIFPVLYSTENINIPRSTPLYAMYRGVCNKKDEGIFLQRKIRFDITIMSNINIGKEWNKTLGHYHPIAENNLSYPELYQVLYGKATFLLQKKIDNEVIDFVIAEVKQGEALLIPPNYGHVTVNSSDEILIMANLVSSIFQSLYEDYIRHKGAAYYLLIDGSLIPNPNYEKIAKPRFSYKRFPISKDIYSDFISCPSCFNFLNHPSLISDLSI